MRTSRHFGNLTLLKPVIPSLSKDQTHNRTRDRLESFPLATFRARPTLAERKTCLILRQAQDNGRFLSNQGEENAGEEDVGERERENAFPAEAHQLIIAETGKSPAHPDEEDDEETHFNQE